MKTESTLPLKAAYKVKSFAPTLIVRNFAMIKVTIDKKFKITIPKFLRSDFPAGCTVTIEKSTDGVIIISRSKKHSLEELLSATPANSIVPDWESMPDVGLESK